MAEENTALQQVTKKCPHCKADIPASAKKCSHCGSDLRVWPIRHPLWSIFFIVVFLIIIGGASKPTQQVNVPSTSAQDASATTVQESIPLNNNNPSIKQLSTLPSDYVGQSFILDVNAETANYYNYAFSDDSAWYSLEVWDDSVSDDFEGVYAYLPKNDTNKQLVNALLSAPEKLEVHATIPAADWESNSNAFLEITSWKLLQ